MREPVERPGNEGKGSGGEKRPSVSGPSAHYRYRAFISYSHKADSRFAPILQSSIEQLGKPWYRRRALSVFRDDTDLAVSPHLWPTIEEALNDSDYLLLLACPKSAEADGVRKEINHWTQVLKRDTSKLLIAVTGGKLVWSDADQDFDWSQTDALPVELKDYFRAQPEPLWADFSSCKAEERVGPEDATFRRAAVKLAAGLHGIAPRDLESEDLRQHRKTIRIFTAFVTGLLVLLIGTILLFFDVRRQRNEAERRGQIAESRALAAQAMDRSDKRLDVALLLAVASHRLSDTIESRKALWGTLAASPHVDRFLHAPSGTVEALTFHPKRPVLAAAGDSVFAWDLDSNAPPRRFEESGEKTKAVTFLDSGALLAAVTESGKVVIWEFEKGTKVFSAGGGKEVTMQPAVGGQANRMLAVITGSGVVIWNLQTRAVQSTVPYPVEDPVLAVALSPSEEVVAISSRSGVRLWDARKNQYRSTEFDGHAGPVTALAFSPDGEILASGGQDESVVLWEAASGMLERQLIKQGWASEMRFSPDGRFLAWCSLGNRLRVHDRKLDSGVAIPNAIVTAPTPSIAFSPDSRRLAIGTDAAGQVVQLDLMNEYSTVAVRMAHKDSVIGLAVSQDGRVAASASRDGELILWDTTTMRIRSRFRVPTQIGPCTEFSPDGKIVVTCAPGGAIIWRGGVDSLAPTGAIQTSQGDIRTVAFSPDGKVLLSGGDKGELVAWNAAALKNSKPEHLASAGADITALEFSPKGDAIVVGGGDGKIRLTDRKGKTTSEFSWGGNYISGLKFSPDASRIYSASAEGVVVWNLRTRSAIGTPLDLNRAGASLIGMSRDGKLVASGSRDGTVALWDAELRVLLGTLPIPGSMAFSLAFAPGGKFLVIGSGYEIPVDNSVVFWDLDPESWVRRSCAMAGRNLRPEEWQRYAGEATPEDVCSEGRAAGSGLMAR